MKFYARRIKEIIDSVDDPAEVKKVRLEKMLDRIGHFVDEFGKDAILSEFSDAEKKELIPKLFSMVVVSNTRHTKSSRVNPLDPTESFIREHRPS